MAATMGAARQGGRKEKGAPSCSKGWVKCWGHLGGLAGELVEEDLCEAGDAGVLILQAQRQPRDVALHLHHVIQDEVREHHQAVLAHACTCTPHAVMDLPAAPCEFSCTVLACVKISVAGVKLCMTCIFLSASAQKLQLQHQESNVESGHLDTTPIAVEETQIQENT